MGGCLGPKQRKQQVYIEVIQSIHEQVQHMTFTKQNMYQNKSTQNLDIYTLIKQKLSKKGLLRKLIDNLVSHRAKIYDSLNHNYQIVLQNSHIENKYAGLLIIDQIIQGIYQSLKLSQQRVDVEGSENFSNLTNKRTDNLKQSLQIMFGDSKSKQKKRFHMAMQANPLIREIDSRFDTIYFSLIIYLLDNVPKMYMRILKSINSYCLNKRSKFLCTQSVWQVIHFIMSRIVKFLQMKQNVFSYMLLLQNVKENFKQYQKAQDLKLFIDLWIREMTTGKYGRSFCEENQINNNNNFSSNNNNNSNYNNNNNHNNTSHHNNQQSQTTYIKTSQQYIANLIKIISLYFDTNISTWNSNFLYDVMLDIYDQHQFQIEKILTFQSVIFNIVMKNQLHVQFFRGLFLLLLDYLGYRHAVRGSRVQSTMSLHGEVNEIKWMNCQKKHVKYNALKTLRRWVVNKHIDLNETVSYNCRLLFQAYLTNYSLTDLQYNTEVSKQFLKLIRQNLQIKSKKIVIITITQSIKQEDIDSRIRSICVGLLRELLGDGGVLMIGARDSVNNGVSKNNIDNSSKNNIDNSINNNSIDNNLMIQNDNDLGNDINDITALDVIITIQDYYSKQNKLQLIQLMGFILHTLPSTYYSTPININFMHKLGDFLYSCYSTIIESQDDLVFMLRFVCSIVSVMREVCLIKQNVSVGFVVYSEMVNKLGYYCLGVNSNSGNNTKDSQEQAQKQTITTMKTTPPKKQQPIPPSINKLKFYFLYYLTCEIGRLLYDNIKVPKQQFMKINQKITKSQTITQGLMGTNKSIHHDKREQVFSLIDKLLSQPVFKDTNILKQSFKQQEIFQALKPHLEKENYRQTQKIISSYFNNYCSRSTTNRNTNSNNEQDRENNNNNNINSQNFLNNSMSGNFGNKTGLSNAFGRRDSVFMESENSSFYRQEDKNLKDVLGIINC